MNITIVTGQKGSGKSTYLENLINNSFDGVITKCINRKEKKYYFKLINKSRNLLCCYYDNGMKFNKYNFDLVNDYLLDVNNKKIKKNIIIDEIGWLELENKGLYIALKKILNNRNIKNLYISMRYDIYEKLIKKLEIRDYKLVNLSEIR